MFSRPLPLLVVDLEQPERHLLAEQAVLEALEVVVGILVLMAVLATLQQQHLHKVATEVVVYLEVAVVVVDHPQMVQMETLMAPEVMVAADHPLQFLDHL